MKLEPFHVALSNVFQETKDLLHKGTFTDTHRNAFVSMLAFAPGVKIPAAEAHKVAERHSDLTEVCDWAGEAVLSVLAENMLDNLRERKDEPEKTEDVQVGQLDEGDECRFEGEKYIASSHRHTGMVWLVGLDGKNRGRAIGLSETHVVPKIVKKDAKPATNTMADANGNAII